MVVDGMSHIAIDPNIDITMWTAKTRRVRVMPYDFNTPFNMKVLSILKRRSTFLWAKCKSGYFIERALLSKVMSIAGIPASRSYPGW